MLRHGEGDVRDRRALGDALASSGADRVVHGAVITAGRARESRDPASIVATNVQGTVNVLEAARHAGVARFVFLSSASVYGDNATAHPWLSEADTAPRPRSLYAVTKHAAEGVARRYGEIFDMAVVAARLSAVFGRWEHDTGLRDTLSPPYLLAGLAAAGARAVLAREGERDWIYGPDAAGGIIALLDAPALGHDVYNVSTGRTWSLRAWCERLAGAVARVLLLRGRPRGRSRAGSRRALAAGHRPSAPGYHV